MRKKEGHTWLRVCAGPKILNIFQGEDNDFSKAVCLNAAAGLIVSEKYDDFKIAYNYTREFIKSGAIFLDFDENLSFLIASRFDLSSPTTTKPIIPIFL